MFVGPRRCRRPRERPADVRYSAHGTPNVIRVHTASEERMRQCLRLAVLLAALALLTVACGRDPSGRSTTADTSAPVVTAAEVSASASPSPRLTPVDVPTVAPGFAQVVNIQSFACLDIYSAPDRSAPLVDCVAYGTLLRIAGTEHPDLCDGVARHGWVSSRLPARAVSRVRSTSSIRAKARDLPCRHPGACGWSLIGESITSEAEA